MITLNIQKKLHGADRVFDLDVQARIQKGEIVSLYGPSGAGKSCLLRIVAGLLAPDGGEISVDGEIWYSRDDKINLRPQSRNIGMVFQDYSLFPNMSVRVNMEYALNKGQSSLVVDEMLEMTELENLQHKMPATLSGGQKQRVALARALIRKPKLLLLDEPLSALDSAMRVKLQEYIFQFHHNMGLTTLLVSHDFNEVVQLSKRVLLIEEGKVKKDGPPMEVLA